MTGAGILILRLAGLGGFSYLVSCFCYPHRSTRRYTFCDSSLYGENLDETKQTFSVHVSYDERSAQKSQRGYGEPTSIDISIEEGETILSALERASSPGVGKLTGNIFPPASDCRRGNCMTCSARHDNDSEVSRVESLSNGLSPHVAQQIADQGYILTCSSTITGPGVSLKLGQNNHLWDYVYRQRLESQSTQTTAHAAMAKAIRLSAERNVGEWKEQTERVYEASTAEQDD